MAERIGLLMSWYVISGAMSLLIAWLVMALTICFHPELVECLYEMATPTLGLFVIFSFLGVGLTLIDMVKTTFERQDNGNKS